MPPLAPTARRLPPPAPSRRHTTLAAAAVARAVTRGLAAPPRQRGQLLRGGRVLATMADEADTLPLPRRDFDDEQARVLELSKDLIKRLTDAGHVALIAGGWVRDALLGRRSVDVDVATSAPPSAVTALFDRVVPMPNDTLIVVLDGTPFEVTPFRVAGVAGRGGVGEGDTSTSTPPLAAAKRDAAARDFTVNALFYDPLTDRVLDYEGGAGDCASRTLRGCGGDPAARMAEDPLRALRAVRFAAGLGLALDDDTARAATGAAAACAPPTVAIERVWKEWVKLAAYEPERPGAFADGIRLARGLGLLERTLPEACGSADAAAAADASLRRLPPDTPPALWVATALPDDVVDSPERVAALAARCKLSKKEAKSLEALTTVRALDARAPPPAPMDWVAFYAGDSAEAAVAAAGARIADAETRKAHTNTHADRRARYAAGIDRARANKPLLTAAAALAAGAPKGRALGEVLKRGEAVAVERGLATGEQVIAALRQGGEWPGE